MPGVVRKQESSDGSQPLLELGFIIINNDRRHRTNQGLLRPARSPHHDSELFYDLRRHPNLRCTATPNQRCTPPPNRNPNLRAPPSDLSRHL